MKDRHAILSLAVVLSIMVQLTMVFSQFTLLATYIIPVLACVLLTIIQRRNQNTFGGHLLKSLKIVSLGYILFFPIGLFLSFLLSIRLVDNSLLESLKEGFNGFAAKIPKLFGAAILLGVVLFLSFIFLVMISYLIGKRKSGKHNLP